jgi:hypothetical protein
MGEIDEIILKNELNHLCFQCKYDIIMIDGMKGDSDDLFIPIFNETLEYFTNIGDYVKCSNLMKWKR